MDLVAVHSQWLLGELFVQRYVTSCRLRRRNLQHVSDHFIDVHFLRVESPFREETPQAHDDLGRPLIVAFDVIDYSLDLV